MEHWTLEADLPLAKRHSNPSTHAIGKLTPLVHAIIHHSVTVLGFAVEVVIM